MEIENEIGIFLCTIESEAKILRLNGWTQIDICKKLNISRGTLRYWIRDIVLTKEQKEKINFNKSLKLLRDTLSQF